MYLGLDTSTTSTGYHIKDSDGETVSNGLIKPPGPLPERLLYLFKAIRRILRTHDITLAAIEGYAFGFGGRGSTSVYQTAEAGGVAKAALVLCEVPFLMVAPNSLKKYATGKGKGKKDLIVKCYEKETGYRAKTSDIADSYYLSRVAHSYDSWPDCGELTTAQLQVILEMRRVDEEGREKKNIWRP